MTKGIQDLANYGRYKFTEYYKYLHVQPETNIQRENFESKIQQFEKAINEKDFVKRKL